MGEKMLKENVVTFTKRESLQCNEKNYDLEVRKPGSTPDLLLTCFLALSCWVFVSEKQLANRKMRKYSEVTFVISGSLGVWT